MMYFKLKGSSFLPEIFIVRQTCDDVKGGLSESTSPEFWDEVNEA